jgi:hypothetical protein
VLYDAPWKERQARVLISLGAAALAVISATIALWAWGFADAIR